MKKILFATDFSESCDSALSNLMQITDGLDVTIDLAHSYHLPFIRSMRGLEVSVRQELEITKKHYQEKLDFRLEKINSKNRGNAHLVYGLVPSTDVIDTALSISADLIVLSMRDKYSRMNRIIGTVTAHIIQKTNIPVLAIPFGANFSKIDKVLYPFDSNSTALAKNTIYEDAQWLEDLLRGSQEIVYDIIHVKHSDFESLDINYPNQPSIGFNFKITHSSSIEEGIHNAISRNRYDLLLLRKNPSNLLKRIFNSSKTTNFLYNSNLPLLAV